MRKIIFYFLLLLNILLPLAIISNSFDGDLGWHLRFGQQLHTGSFPYTDTYTYSKYGSPWTNHEWGGDWLFWLIYSRFGYWWLNLLTALAITSAFLIIGKTFYKKINITFLVSSLLCQWGIAHILVARLAMFTPLFAAVTFYIAEKTKTDHRWLYLIPPLFWLWSILHGSWILGFIILNLYLTSGLIINFFPKKYLPHLNDAVWTKKSIYQIIFIQLVAAIFIIVNPYGLKIWWEIIEYFGQNYYKLHTTEWLPSYSFPIFWKILIIQTVALVLATYGFIKQKISFTHLLIFLAFYYAAIAYKRQGIFMGLLSAPILATTAELMQTEFKKNSFLNSSFIKNNFNFFSFGAIVVLFFYYIINIHLTKDIWTDKFLSEKNSFPYEGVHWLQTNVTQPTKIFNSFNWGAYLNWTMPNALIFFDGRGTATWMYDKNKTMMEHYYEILEQSGGLKEIEHDQVSYILLRQTNFIPIAKPDAVNDWFFGKDAATFSYAGKTNLEKDLDTTTTWKKIYSDYQVNIWQNLNLSPR